MPERDQNKPETAEEVGQRIIEFVEAAEFGSPQYEAVNDYLHMRKLENNLQVEQSNSMSKEAGSEKEADWESQVRITEHEIAIHRFQVYQNQKQVKGYFAAYAHMGTGLEHDFSDAVYEEAERLHADDEHQQEFYVRNFYEKIVGKSEDILISKRY